MSLKRLIYYSAIIGGWSAFFGWLVAELLLSRDALGGRVGVAITCALVGGAIGAGLNLVAGMANAQWKQQIMRAVPGLIAGSIGGAVGGVIGDLLFAFIHLPRAFGWMIMGAGIGIVEGLYERSPAKLRNGLIGGSIGGLIGGFLFDPIRNMNGAGSGMSSRATAFVILGLCIGVLIGLVKVVLKSAWLTVVDGYRPGRQLILAEGQAVLGSAEYATLPFRGQSDGKVALEHARILRQTDGRFVVEDCGSELGTIVNGMRVQGRQLLKDDDKIIIGSNRIVFSERQRHTDEQPAPSNPLYARPPQVLAPSPPGNGAPAPVGQRPLNIPPPPPGGRTGAAVSGNAGGGPPPLGSQPPSSPAPAPIPGGATRPGGSVGAPPLGARPSPMIPPPPGGPRPVPAQNEPAMGASPARPTNIPAPGGSPARPGGGVPPAAGTPTPVTPAAPGAPRPAGSAPPPGAKPAPVIPPPPGATSPSRGAPPPPGGKPAPFIPPPPAGQSSAGGGMVRCTQCGTMTPRSQQKCSKCDKPL